MPLGRRMTFSPAPSSAPPSPQLSSIRSSTAAVLHQEKYLSDLLAERQNLCPFVLVLPHCYQLISQEILRVTTLLGNASHLDHSAFAHSRGDENGWTSAFQPEKMGMLPRTFNQNCPEPHGCSSGQVVKKLIRVDIPIDKYPNYNFVGRLLGPRGNSLKLVEASTGCRVLIRGQGSIKDPLQEEIMRGCPGYEHLNEPLHIIVEAEFPVEIVDAHLMQAREILGELLNPVGETQDLFKLQQLRELAMLNGALRHGSPASGSVSPFHDNFGMKRAKTVER